MHEFLQSDLAFIFALSGFALFISFLVAEFILSLVDEIVIRSRSRAKRLDRGRRVGETES